MGGIGFSPVMNLWLQRRQTWNLNRIGLKGNKIVKTLILMETENSDISNLI